jgi:lactoylglutathione lyase
MVQNTTSLGAFSISLAVKDLAASRAFYEKLGFTIFGGNADQKWLILKNGNAMIGIFQGIFERNILTFNPGWDDTASPLESFTDVRDVKKSLEAQGVATRVVEVGGESGPASFVVVDPDGNEVLIDQHR